MNSVRSVIIIKKSYTKSNYLNYILLFIFVICFLCLFRLQSGIVLLNCLVSSVYSDRRTFVKCWVNLAGHEFVDCVSSLMMQVFYNIYSHFFSAMTNVNFVFACISHHSVGNRFLLLNIRQNLEIRVELCYLKRTQHAVWTSLRLNP